MHPDDKKTVDWLNGLQVPYMSKWDFVREIAKHPPRPQLEDMV